MKNIKIKNPFSKIFSKKQQIVLAATLGFILLVSLAFKFINRVNPEEYVESFYGLSAYSTAYQLYYEDVEDPIEKSYYYQAEVGTMEIDDKNEPTEFNLLEQYFFKDSEGKWNVTILGNDFVPGSPEHLLNLSKENANERILKVSTDKVCKKLEIKNCVVFFVQGIEEEDSNTHLYFEKKDKKPVAMTMKGEDYEALYLFGNINDDTINIGGKFDLMREEITKDLGTAEE